MRERTNENYCLAQGTPPSSLWWPKGEESKKRGCTSTCGWSALSSGRKHHDAVKNMHACVLRRLWLSAALLGCSLPGSSVHGLSRQEYWSGLPLLPPGDLLNPGTELTWPASPALQAYSLPLSYFGKASKQYSNKKFLKKYIGVYIYIWYIWENIKKVNIIFVHKNSRFVSLIF